MTVEPSAPTPVYEDAVSDIYDCFYQSRGKDFAAEAAAVAVVIRERDPAADSVLDVASGTGEHLRWLADVFPTVAGLELSPAMCAVARAKLPHVPIHQADLRDFQLTEQFAAATCLTSTLGYLSDESELRTAVAAIARAVRPGGTVVIDPWWTPEQFVDRYVAADVVRDEERAIARVSHSARRDRRAVRHEAHYLVADDGGLRHFTHHQTLHLFTTDEYLTALATAGCDPEHVSNPAFPDRGLFVGTRCGG